jgi:hypothetical protein
MFVNPFHIIPASVARVVKYSLVLNLLESLMSVSHPHFSVTCPAHLLVVDFIILIVQIVDGHVM